MATTREVTVKVNMVAGGNAGAALKANADAARGTGGGGGAAVNASTDYMAKAIKARADREGKAASENILQYGQTGAALANFRDKIAESGVVRASMIGLAAATGAVAAASPAAFETLFGSVKLLAGEIGIMLIPAVVTVSGWLQDLAGTVRKVNDATGGLLGKVVTVGVATAAIVVVGSKLIDMTLAVVSATQSIARLGVAADGAAERGGGGGGGGKGGKGGKGGGGIGGLVEGGIALVSAVGFAAGADEERRKQWGMFSNALGITSGAATPEAIAAERAKISMNFQGGASSLLASRDAIQTEVIRDPMQQATYELQQRALETLINRVEQLTRETQMNRPPAPNEANQ